MPFISPVRKTWSCSFLEAWVWPKHELINMLGSKAYDNIKDESSSYFEKHIFYNWINLRSPRICIIFHLLVTLGLDLNVALSESPSRQHPPLIPHHNLLTKLYWPSRHSYALFLFSLSPQPDCGTWEFCSLLGYGDIMVLFLFSHPHI